MMDIILYDRIKEISYTIGTGNIALAGSVGGFSSFSSVYSNNDKLFYAITDGVYYEVGSGVYLSSNQIQRFPLKSTNSNNLVNFPEGLKEIYCTYPATHAIINGSGLNGNNGASNSGIAFWSSHNSITYDSNILWDKANSRLGINKNAPSYTLDIGGTAAKSIVRSSGTIVGSSGIYFPSGNNGSSSYFGGRQLTHYEMNQLDQYAYNNSLIGELTGSADVIQLSGSANQFILFKPQTAGLVFAGPASGCTPPCSPGYPSFRPLTLEDIPNLNSLYATKAEILTVSGMVIALSGWIQSLL